VLVGRAYAYGLAAAGEQGVARAIEILRHDLIRTLKLLGCGSVTELNPSYVQVPAGWAMPGRQWTHLSVRAGGADRSFE
jgi:L-lactate dehydrogenase (cytochrome)